MSPFDPLFDQGRAAHFANAFWSGFSGNDIAFRLTFGESPIVPEPGTLLLLGSGLVALGMWRRRRRALKSHRRVIARNL